METILRDLNTVVGVTGSFVADSDGEVLARALPGVFDDDMLTTAARSAAQTILGLETTRRRKVGELDLVYQDGRLVTKRMKSGFLLILCIRNINVPLLNLTANVAARKLEGVMAGSAAADRVRREPAAADRHPASAPARLAVRESDAPIAPGEEGKTAPLEKAELAVPMATLEARTKQAVAKAAEAGVLLRALGTTAVRLRCPSADAMTIPFAEPELDFTGYGRDRKTITRILEEAGYEPEKRFNALHGRTRLRFVHPEDGTQVHIFLDSFSMCHKLDFAHRLELDEVTIPLADLLLTKLQVVEMSEGELREIYALLHDHELGDIADAEKIDGDRITSLCADDWGWYRTATMNLERGMSLAEEFLTESQREQVLTKVKRLEQLIEASDKSVRWQLRAQVGDARRWYDMPEDL
ncbi:MAG: roadblock/LC7 domain-containing protein [Anaerolineae bacterium]